MGGGMGGGGGGWADGTLGGGGGGGWADATPAPRKRQRLLPHFTAAQAEQRAQEERQRHEMQQQAVLLPPKTRGACLWCGARPVHP